MKKKKGTVKPAVSGGMMARKNSWTDCINQWYNLMDRLAEVHSVSLN